MSLVAGNGEVGVERVKCREKCLWECKVLCKIGTRGWIQKKRLYERVIVPTTLYGAETWNVREA